MKQAGTLRTAIGIGAAIAGALILTWRIREIRETPRVTVSPRVVQLMRNRHLALRVQDYARTHGRPAFRMDSVTIHLRGDDALETERYLTDVWGNSVGYMWEWCSFWISSPGDAPHRGVWEEFGWPASAVAGRDCDGGH